VEFEIKNWQTLERENENFSIKYPNGWYYTVNHEDAKDLGYELIIGFASTSKIWEQVSPYDIELLIMSEYLEIEEIPGRIIRQVQLESKKKYVLITFKEENKDIIDKMADSFKFIN